MPDLDLKHSHESHDLLDKLQKEISETYRGVLELAFESGDSDNLEQALALKDEVNKLTTELDETYRGVIELATSLENSEQKVDMMLQGAELGLWEWLPESDELTVNSEWKNIVGLSQQHTIENIENYDEIIHPDDLANVRRARTSFLNGQRKIFHVEHRLKSDSNGWIWVLCNGRAVDKSKDGKPLKVMGSMLNISLRKKTEKKVEALNVSLEQQVAERTLETERTNNKLLNEIRGHQETVRALRQARKSAESANNAKTSFVSNISHELRTPLNAILGYAQLLATDKSLNKTQNQQIFSINRAGNHLLGLLNNVLDMAKIESGHTSRNLKVFNLHQLLDDIKSLFTLRCQQKDLTLTVNLNNDVSQFILSDEQKIRQIIINLLGNAIKFTKQGHVKLNVSLLEKKDQQQMLSFKVEDTGSGIEKNNIETIFEAFDQTQEGKQTQEGTGLGLAISKEFAFLLGGDITVDSKINVGSCFNFTCQVEISSSQSIDSLESNYRITCVKPGQKEIRVLVADDDEAGRDIVIKLLSSMGMHTREAESEKQAMSQLLEWQPNILIINISILTTDSIGKIKNSKAKALSNGIEMVIVAVSTSATEENIQDKLPQCIDTIVYKPLNLNSLLQTIEEYTTIDFISEKTLDNSLDEPDISLASMTELVIDLPDDLKQELRKAVFLGDAQKLRTLTSDIEKYNNELAGIFNQYINNYNLEPLTKLLE